MKTNDQILKEWFEGVSPFLRERVTTVLTSRRDSQHGNGILVDTGSTSAFEHCSIEAFEDGWVSAQGSNASFNDFLGFARGEDADFVAPADLAVALSEFRASWDSC